MATSSAATGDDSAAPLVPDGAAAQPYGAAPPEYVEPDPIEGNIYIWLAHGSRGRKTKMSDGIELYVGIVLLILLQMLAPLFILYYSVYIIDWSTVQIGFSEYQTVPSHVDASGYLDMDSYLDMPNWPNILSKKVIAGICFYLFTFQVQRALHSKGVDVAKMNTLDCMSYGVVSNRMLKTIGFSIVALANIFCIIATWLTLLICTDIVSVFTNVTGLSLLTNSDSMGGVDLTPLGADLWDSLAIGKHYYATYKKAKPDEDPDDSRSPFLAEHVSCAITVADVLISILKYVLSASFILLDQSVLKTRTF
mmetsp:Transcript_89085/g.260373  ORF Transcript_89085/g.260373 Transcript_89085/m.260373 type:complete len:308 (-) Transcript_89085:212-1135(-)